MSYQISTKCVAGESDSIEGGDLGAVSFPIYQTATFARPEIGEGSGYDYSRLQNPTREKLEQVVCALEGGIDALAFSSGMAAISAMMEMFKPGDHLIIDSDMYGGSVRLFQHISEKNGIQITSVDCSLVKEAEIKALIKPSTVGIFVETPTNPMMHIIDISALARIAKAARIHLIVDNTFLTPYLQNPLDLGADIVIHSGTKYLGGHNDTLAGFLITSSMSVAEKMRFIIKTIGSGLAPFDSWLILRGIKTLGIRMRASEENAKILVEWLLNEEKVTKVYYPGLPDHPGHDLAKSQARGFGAMVSFEVESEELAKNVLKKIKLIRFAESLGGVESLLTYPITQTHADVPLDVLAANNITTRLLRMSVGIEDIVDLEADIKQAFNF